MPIDAQQPIDPREPRDPNVVFRDPNAPDHRPRVVSIQVAPCFEEEGHLVVSQFLEGPNEQTTFWSLYARGDDGMARCIRDVELPSQDASRRFAEKLAADVAARLGVPVEPYLWAPKIERSAPTAPSLADAVEGLPREKAARFVARAEADVEHFVSHARTR